MVVSDIVLLKDLPSEIKNNVGAYVGCISGAVKKDEYLRHIKKAGFRNVEVLKETSFPMEFMANDPTANAIIKNMKIPREKMRGLANSIVSIEVTGAKPG